MCCNLEPADTAALSRLCQGRRGWCSFSGKRHWVLSGSSPSGVPWTRVAQPYPQRLARALSKALLAPAFAAATFNRNSFSPHPHRGPEQLPF